MIKYHNDSSTLRVLSYNTHKGFSFGNISFVLERIRAALREAAPDLAFLQEILGAHRTHMNRVANGAIASQFEYLADTEWPHYAYGKNAIYERGHHGNAILSKFPFTHWDNLDISQNRMERRGLLHGVIPIPNSAKPLHAICLHLNLLESGRRAQLRALCKRINEHIPADHPLIIGGDFNDWQGRASEMLRSEIGLEEAFQRFHGSHARTYPARFPMLPLDRFYFRGLDIKAATVPRDSSWKSLSDHLPLICEFAFD